MVMKLIDVISIGQAAKLEIMEVFFNSKIWILTIFFKL